MSPSGSAPFHGLSRRALGVRPASPNASPPETALQYTPRPSFRAAKAFAEFTYLPYFLLAAYQKNGFRRGNLIKNSI